MKFNFMLRVMEKRKVSEFAKVFTACSDEKPFFALFLGKGSVRLIASKAHLIHISDFIVTTTRQCSGEKLLHFHSELRDQLPACISINSIVVVYHSKTFCLPRKCVCVRVSEDET